MPFCMLRHLVMLGLFATTFADPCSDYLEIDDPKRSVLSQLDSTSTPICDQYRILAGQWYRFTNNVGGKIPEHCPEVNMCGTQYPIWLQGTHPTDDTMVSATVCLSTGPSECCAWSDTIQIQRCTVGGGDPYYVYALKPPPAFSAAYCAGDREPCPDGLVHVDQIGCTDACPAMHTLPTISDPIVTFHPGDVTIENRFHFDCSIHDYQDVAQYRIRFLFDGQPATETDLAPVNDIIVNGTHPFGSLHDYQLRGRLGKTLTCWVQPFYENITVKECEGKNSSNSYWAGIKVNEHVGLPIILRQVNRTQFFLEHGHYPPDEEPVRVPLVSTIPIFCPVGTSYCNVGFSMDVDLAKTTSVCQTSLSSMHWIQSFEYSQHQLYDQAWQETEYDQNVITIAPLEDDVTKINGFPTHISFSEISLFLKSLSDNSDAKFPIFHGYKPEEIPVEIHGDTVPSRVCYSEGDPYITTFDGRHYPALAIGDFIAVKSTTSGNAFEIQVRQQPCQSGMTDISCNCAVAVREDNIILGVDMCQKPGQQTYPRFIRYLGDESAQVFGANIVEIHELNWRIFMPSGVRVDVHYAALWTDNSLLDLYIHLPGKMMGQVEGLCGNFNGDIADDLTPQGEAFNSSDYYYYYYNDPEDVATLEESFRVAKEDSFFAGPPNCVDIPERNTTLCSCERRNLTDIGDKIDQVTCASNAKEIPLLESPYTCNGGKLRRVKRDLIGDVMPDYVLSYEELYSDALEGPGRQLPLDLDNWPSDHSINKTHATFLCTSTLQSSPVYSSCLDDIDFEQHMNECLWDLYLMDDATILKSKVVNMQTSCIASKTASIVLTGNKTIDEVENVIYRELQAVLSSICPGNCNQRGSCVDGVCKCTTGYGGDDCSIDLDQPPILNGISGGKVCNKQYKTCQSVRIAASGVPNNKNLKCRFQGKNMLSGEESGSIDYIGDGIYVSRFEVICILPPISAFTGSKDGYAAFQYKISISYDGQKFGNEDTFIVHDGACVACDEFQCLIKEHTCAIEGRCYDGGMENIDSKCEKCIADDNQFQWSTIEDSSECAMNEKSKIGALTQWSPWAEWGSCEKDCDKVLRRRTRTCESSTCSGKAKEYTLCDQEPCSIIPIEEKLGLLIEIEGDDLSTILPKVPESFAKMAESVNQYCKDNLKECCLMVDIVYERDLSPHDFTLTESELFSIASGYPNINHNNTRINVVAMFYKADLLEQCSAAENRISKRDSNLGYIDPSILLESTSESKLFIEEILDAKIIRVHTYSMDDGHSKDNGLSVYAIVGISVGIAVLLLVPIITIIAVIHKKKLGEEKKCQRPNKQPDGHNRVYVQSPTQLDLYLADECNKGIPASTVFPSTKRPSMIGFDLVQSSRPNSSSSAVRVFSANYDGDAYQSQSLTPI